MNIQPTPISDRIVSQFRKGEAHSDGLILTMVDLELKLIAALAEIDRLDVAGIHTCHSECQKSNCVLRRELAAVTEERDSIDSMYQKIIKEVLECDPIPACKREEDQLEPPWEVIARIRERECKRLQTELTAITEQRDMLVEALEIAANRFRYPEFECNWEDVSKEIESVLQSLTPNTKP